ncbi:hypothetical protein CDL15_Pgr016762 [Punica granatum]|uniref:Uncharacterized protein n=1 Tax=Punica granatum TaxID=22663 RepID=A0A218WWW1_PUNGR|nr:hypothetical protein CDL15_Pgr016762 [Punica granatum]
MDRGLAKTVIKLGLLTTYKVIMDILKFAILPKFALPLVRANTRTIQVHDEAPVQPHRSLMMALDSPVIG